MKYSVIYNGFWNREAPDAVRRLSEAFARHGHTVTVLKHTDCVVSVAPTVSVAPFAAGDAVLFWDKDTRLAKALEQMGVRVYNTASSIALCDDKSETHRVLAAHGIPMPQTFLAPMAYTEVTEAAEPFLCTAEQALGYPLVVKECFGSLGEQVYLANDSAQLRELAYGMHHRPFLLQRFIREAAGEDRRLYVVGDRVIAAMCRRNTSDFRANIALGGEALPYTPTAAEEALALRCCRVLGLQFAGVDLLTNGMVCEVNSNAQMAGITACTGVDIADHIVTYVLEQEERRA